jgi:N-acetylneuraminic acid mutarotase
MLTLRAPTVFFRWIAVLLTTLSIVSCGGGGGDNASTSSSTTSGGSSPPPTSFAATSGVAQKGPLIMGSTVTAQELDAQLDPTGKQYTYQITSNLGTFQPTATFTSQYIGLFATGYYFDEVMDAVSGGTISLNGYSDLSSSTVLNVNLLTTLAYQRIQSLVKSGSSFSAARTQAEQEVLQALHIPPGNYGAFGELDLSKGTEGDQILAAVSSLFVYGNSSGELAALIAAVQSDIGANGTITNATTLATLKASGMALDPVIIAANLTQEYASLGVTFVPTDISNWVDQDGDGLVGKVKFQVLQATASSSQALPTWLTDAYAGTSLSLSAGQLSVNGAVVSGPVTTNVGDVISVAPASGFSNGTLTAYLSSGATPIARVSFFGSNSWAPRAPMNIPTTGQTATLLPSGLLLITGGTTSLPGANGGGNSTLASTELYDPVANTWTAAAPMSTPRTGHSAILLATGQVLVVGGATAELYNPGTNAWSSAGTLAVAVGGQAAVLLPSGNVLVTGGSNVSTQNPVTTAQIYNPANNSWSTVAPMLTARWMHTAVVLQDGTVLVAGGSDGQCCDTPDAILASAEVYSPSANTWTAVGSMSTTRAGQTAVLLGNGSVLVAGGETATQINPYEPASSSLASAELYNPASQTWTPAGSMQAARWFHTMTVLTGGKVLVAGGYDIDIDGTSSTLADAEIYDPTANTWTAAAPMNEARRSHTATLLGGGTVVVTGGLDNNSLLGSVESYSP